MIAALKREASCFPFFLLIFSLFLACSRENGDVISDSKAVLISFYQELKTINTRQDLLQRQDILEKKFLDLAESLINLSESGQTLALIEERGLETGSIQKEILNELERLYQIDGCQELIERAQMAALELIDKYEHSMEVKAKKRESSLN